MLEGLSGSTRLYVIVGDPIAQVKAPEGITRAFEARGRNAVLVPAHVAAQALDACVTGLSSLQNLDGIIATIPHKAAMVRHCATLTDRAAFLGAANLLRRGASGWHGEMSDGVGFVTAQRARGCVHAGKRALLVGAGGAGSAIALALLDAGVRELAISDADAGRRDALIGKLSGRFASVTAGSDDPAGFDIVCNATPSGMRADDRPPVRLDRVAAGMFVGDVVTAPEVTPLLAAARAAGCGTSTGIEMFHAQLDLIADFLIGAR